MAITQQIRAQQYNQNLIRYLLLTVWKRKFWFVLAMVVGATLATLTVYLNPPKYLAKATFLADLPILARQVESLESRDLLLRSLEKVHHVKLQCYSKGRFGREADFYNQSPVAVQTMSFPAHLENVEMELKFAGDSRYTLSFEAVGEKVSAEGRFGKTLSVGSISILVEPTRFWSGRYEGESIFFQVHSLQYLAARSAGNYRVENLNHRKNRIAIYYSDDNPDRAYDILKAVTEEAMTGYYERINVLINARNGSIRNQMDALLKKMMGDDDLGRLLQGKEFATENAEIDSLVTVLEMLDARLARFKGRDSLLLDLKETQVAGEGFWDKFLFDRTDRQDSALLSLLEAQHQLRVDTTVDLNNLRQQNLSVQRSVRQILTSDSLISGRIRQQKTDLEDRLMMNIQLRQTIISNSIDRRNLSNKGIVNWEAYLQNAVDKYLTEKESTEIAPRFNLIESPFVINPSRRLFQMKKIISGAMTAALLMLGFVFLSAIGGRKIRSPQHLHVVRSLPLQTLISEKETAKAVRRLQVALEMERKPEEKVVSVLSVLRKDEFDQLAQQLAARYISAGLKVHVFPNDPPEPDADSSPLDLSVYMLSRDRENRLKAAMEEYDLVIQHLPALREYPESWYLAKQHRHLIYMAAAYENTYSEIKELESMIEKNELQVYMYFAVG